ncbi:MAG: aminodeoxychorismate/anthranilate synthase component II [Candidatus Peregrinibacteria bacterium]|nr:aminodeoxychorismate/anthranilate synthase component II [Candidatus Peregrinibacteria bacterium]MDZ4244778.1 aminodeoxychorismate/anthranilate synthase component II [Candidatus Gracilibacteria bacterium]
MRKTLLIDNYDSFTYNLYQFLGELGGNPIVFRNNEITLEDIKNLEPTHIVISPGPGTVENEEDFGICKQLLAEMGNGNPKLQVPLLGVCLGHQGIIKHFGGKIKKAPQIIHGKRSTIKLRGTSKLFSQIPREFDGMRYHSLIGANPGKKLLVTAVLDHNTSNTTTSPKDEIIMAVEHKELPIFGIQFHPESIGTPFGKRILQNFLDYLSSAR